GFALLLVAPVLLPAATAEGTERRLVSFDDAPPAVGSSFGPARVVEAFPFARVALLEGPASALDALRSLPGVAGVYRDEPVTLLLDRARAIDHADPPAGATDWPTGRNVTVALVDSGLDAHRGGRQRGRGARRLRRPRHARRGHRGGERRAEPERPPARPGSRREARRGGHQLLLHDDDGGARLRLDPRAPRPVRHPGGEQFVGAREAGCALRCGRSGDPGVGWALGGWARGGVQRGEPGAR